MDRDATFAELDRLIGAATPEELPTLLGHLTEAEARVRQRLAQPPAAESGRQEVGEEWITPETAARIAGLDDGTEKGLHRGVRRVYEWARRQKWAIRPSRRCLRISERGFRRWLASRP